MKYHLSFVKIIHKNQSAIDAATSPKHHTPEINVIRFANKVIIFVLRYPKIGLNIAILFVANNSNY